MSTMVTVYFYALYTIWSINEEHRRELFMQLKQHFLLKSEYTMKFNPPNLVLL